LKTKNNVFIKKLKPKQKCPKLKRKTKNLRTKTRQFKYNTLEIRLDQVASTNTTSQS